MNTTRIIIFAATIRKRKPDLSNYSQTLACDSIISSYHVDECSEINLHENWLITLLQITNTRSSRALSRMNNVRPGQKTRRGNPDRVEGSISRSHGRSESPPISTAATPGDNRANNQLTVHRHSSPSQA